MGFEKGNKLGGRKKGEPNKITASVKEAFKLAFDNLQESETANLSSWAKDNPTDFYKLASKLIPTDIKADVDSVVTIRIEDET